MASSEGATNEGSERLMCALDEVEKRVQVLRDTALSIESEKEDLLRLLHDIDINHQNLNSVSTAEREDFVANWERLIHRCLTVEVAVTTPRNQQQEKALQQAHHMLDELRLKSNDKLHESKAAILTYLNACSTETAENGVLNQKFQSVVIECTADDQKKIKKTLEDWLSGIEQAELKLMTGK